MAPPRSTPVSDLVGAYGIRHVKRCVAAYLREYSLLGQSVGEISRDASEIVEEWLKIRKVLNPNDPILHIIRQRAHVVLVGTGYYSER